MACCKRIKNNLIGDLLLVEGIISRQQLEEAVARQKNKGGLLGEILVELGHAREEDVIRALTFQYGFPYLPLASYEIESTVFSLVPIAVCERFCLIPIDKIGENLTIAMVNPLNVQAIEAVEGLSGCSVQVFVSTGTDVRSAIKKYYS